MTNTSLRQTNFTDYLTDILYELVIAAWRTCIASFVDTTTHTRGGSRNFCMSVKNDVTFFVRTGFFGGRESENF